MGHTKDPPIVQPRYLFDDDILSVSFFYLTQVVLIFSIKTILAQLPGRPHLCNCKSLFISLFTEWFSIMQIIS